MIQINLYSGGQKSKRTKRGKRPAIVPPAQAGALALAAIALLIVGGTAGVNAYMYRSRTQEAARLEAATQRANADYLRLTQVKLRYEELEKEKDSYKRHVDVIDALRDNQTGPVKLLATLGITVSHTDEVWLNSMSDDGNDINLKGVALSVHGVANLMRNLSNTGYFKAVDIKSSYQDEGVHDMQAFVFELTCHKQPPAAGKS